MTPEDRIVFRSRATAADALVSLNQAGVSSASATETAEFLREFQESCDQAGIDFAFAASHCGNETDLFRDANFKERRNPAGIGITGEEGVREFSGPSSRATAPPLVSTSASS